MFQKEDPSNWPQHPSIVVMPDCPARASVVKVLENDPKYGPPFVVEVAENRIECSPPFDTIPTEINKGLEIAVIDLDCGVGLKAMVQIIADNEQARIIGLSAKPIEETMCSARSVYAPGQDLSAFLQSYLSKQR